MTYHTKTVEASKGRWRGILMALGMPEDVLRDRHGPCPLCESKNNFRWDNKDGSGSYICTCGAGDGMGLAQKFTGEEFAPLARRIDDLIGNITPDTPRQELSDEQRRTALRQVWTASGPIVPGDLADKYLTARGIGELVYPRALRFGPSIKDGEGGVRPCMVAMVAGPDGKPITMHRTFLRPDGLAKAEMAAPRKLMPGPVPDGAAVWLCDWQGGPLGIAEGIETAMSASALYAMPVFAVLTAGMMAKWFPPDGCDEVAIFGDNDPKFGGQAAAYACAHRLAVKGIPVTVHLPDVAGEDWNDILRRKGNG